MLDEIIGVIPNSINVPRLDANIIRSQYLHHHLSMYVSKQRGLEYVQRIGGVGGDNAIERHLGHDQEEPNNFSVLDIRDLGAEAHTRVSHPSTSACSIQPSR